MAATYMSLPLMSSLSNIGSLCGVLTFASQTHIQRIKIRIFRMSQQTVWRKEEIRQTGIE